MTFAVLAVCAVAEAAATTAVAAKMSFTNLFIFLLSGEIIRSRTAQLIKVNFKGQDSLGEDNTMEARSNH